MLKVDDFTTYSYQILETAKIGNGFDPKSIQQC